MNRTVSDRFKPALKTVLFPHANRDRLAFPRGGIAKLYTPGLDLIGIPGNIQMDSEDGFLWITPSGRSSRCGLDEHAGLTAIVSD